jgi:hypothetical protein
MKWSLFIFALLIGALPLRAQSVLKPSAHPKLMVAAGLWTSTQSWMNFRVGIEVKRHAFLVGVHRLLQYRIGYDSRLASIQYVPWQVGADAWYRYYFAQEKATIRPFFRLSLSISRENVMENPRYFLNPQRLGAWMYFEPMVGYGFSWQFTPLFSVSLEAGAGLDIHQYFPKGEKPEPGYWPGSFMGGIAMEKRF